VAGTYTVRVASQVYTGYSLLVTDNVRFESEPNELTTNALRSLDGLGAAIGNVGGSDTRDLYRISVIPGETIRLQTYTPQQGPAGALNNLLDPRLVLFNPSGTQVAADAGSADGKNARINYFAATGGSYFVAVEAEGGTSGDYRLTGSTAVSGPALLDVVVAGSSWTTAFRDKLTSLGLGTGGYSVLPDGSGLVDEIAWTGVNQIAFVFDRPVAAQSSDITLHGINVPTYAVSNFTNVGNVATWTLNQPLAADRLRIEVGSSLESILAAGQLEYPFDSLPGDVTENGTIDRSDMVGVRVHAFTSTANPLYDPTFDTNGDGIINVIDLVIARNRQGTQLPGGTPSPPAPSPISASPAVAPKRALSASRAQRPAAVDAALSAWENQDGAATLRLSTRPRARRGD
jgi:hypothetical protein